METNNQEKTEVNNYQDSGNEKIEFVQEQLVPNNPKQIDSSDEEDDDDEDDDEDYEDEEDEEKDYYKMVFLVRTDLGFKTGKIATQVSTAVLGAYRRAYESGKNIILQNWENQGQPKIVLKVKGEKDLQELNQKATELGINTFLVEDSLQHQEKKILTACAVGPGLEDLINEVTGHLKLY